MIEVLLLLIVLLILGGLIYFLITKKPIIPPPIDEKTKTPQPPPPTDEKTKTPQPPPPTDEKTKTPSKPPLDNNYNQNCYYNTAYEDKDKMDKIQDVEKNVSGCYILTDPDNVNVNTIKKLQDKNNRIGCYISVGTIEDNRSDFSKFKKGVDYSDKNMVDWTHEYVIKGDDKGNPTSNTVNLMKQRIDKLADLNCDYIELDNMDADQEDYLKKYKTNLNSNGMKAYTSGLCNYIHNHPKRKMKCVYKNENSSDYTQFDALQLELNAKDKPSWDTKLIKHFIDNKKPIWVSQYGKKSADECKQSFDDIKQKYGDGFGMVCSVYGNENKYYHYGGSNS